MRNLAAEIIAEEAPLLLWLHLDAPKPEMSHSFLLPFDPYLKGKIKTMFL